MRLPNIAILWLGSFALAVVATAGNVSNYVSSDHPSYTLQVKLTKHNVMCTLITSLGNVSWVENGNTCHVSPAERKAATKD